MDWQCLLSDKRLSARGNRADGRSSFNQDYGRVLYSSAFRRLQDKTQVFPLGRNDYVRTRLTHSLEVANVGRGLAKVMVALIREREGKAARHLPLEGVEDIVATACLAHDIGNPPFGHSGEDAMMASLADTRYASFRFEGNAQGFRLLSRTCDPIRGYGLDLTAAALGAFTKYPCTPEGLGCRKESVSCKKIGVNEEEWPAFEEVAELCGLPSHGERLRARHPLAFLMEAADDISYLIADLEDAYISGLLSYEEAAGQLFRLSGMEPGKIEENRAIYGEASSIRYARAVAVGKCMQCIGEAMARHYGDMMSGELETSLLKASGIKGAYEQVQEFSVQRIYHHEQVLKVEITGFQVINQLMGLFLNWVDAPRSPLGRKLGIILHATATQAESEDTRFRHVIDYISGMTDSFALQTYQNLFGLASTR